MDIGLDNLDLAGGKIKSKFVYILNGCGLYSKMMELLFPSVLSGGV